ncbi:MAG TPA: DUF4129 domain-containing protein [Cellulomonas sp.]
MPSPRPAPAPPGRGTDGRREVLVVLLVAGVVLLTALGGPLVLRWHDPPQWLDVDVAAPTMPQAAPTPPAEMPSAAPQHAAPAWVAQAVKWVALAALVVVTVLVLRYVWRLVRDRWRAIDRGGEGGAGGGFETLDQLDELTQAALGDAVARAARALRDDLPPGDAVIAAWLALERAAERSGVTRDQSQTATEFALALLDRTPADPGAARTLLALYHRARFSDHPVGVADVAAARAALEVLASALARAAAPPATSGPPSPTTDQPPEASS